VYHMEGHDHAVKPIATLRRDLPPAAQREPPIVRACKLRYILSHGHRSQSFARITARSLTLGDELPFRTWDRTNDLPPR
jgi:hypothetical protein